MNRLSEFFAAVGRSGSIPSRGPGSPIMIGLTHRRNLAAKHDKRDHDASHNLLPFLMRVSATAVTPAETCYKRAADWLKMIAPYFGASHTHL